MAKFIHFTFQQMFYCNILVWAPMYIRSHNRMWCGTMCATPWFAFLLWYFYGEWVLFCFYLLVFESRSHCVGWGNAFSANSLRLQVWATTSPGCAISGRSCLTSVHLFRRKSGDGNISLRWGGKEPAIVEYVAIFPAPEVNALQASTQITNVFRGKLITLEQSMDITLKIPRKLCQPEPDREQITHSMVKWEETLME